MKLTGREYEVLKAMSNGGFIWWMDSPKMTCQLPYLCGTGRETQRLTRQLLRRLLDTGFIEPSCQRQLEDSYKLSKDGIAFMETAKEQEAAGIRAVWRKLHNV